MSTFAEVWSATRGADETIAVTQTSDPTGWTLQARVLDYTGQATPVLTVTPTTSGTSPTFYITAAFTAAQTTALTKQTYILEFHRTDSGSATCLASGTLVLGPLICSANEWQSSTGQSLSGAALTALERHTIGVDAALRRMLLPFVPAPLTVTSLVLDAPASRDLILPRRPVRSITSVYVNSTANGDPDAFTSAHLLTADTDYTLPIDDPENGWSRAGILRRVNAVWGQGWYAEPGTLSPRRTGARGAIKITFTAGCTRVPEDVMSAAQAAITLLMNRKTTGVPLNSESFGGYSYSAASQFTAEAAVRSPEVLGFLSRYLTPKFG